MIVSGSDVLDGDNDEKDDACEGMRASSLLGEEGGVKGDGVGLSSSSSCLGDAWVVGMGLGTMMGSRPAVHGHVELASGFSWKDSVYPGSEVHSGLHRHWKKKGWIQFMVALTTGEWTDGENVHGRLHDDVKEPAFAGLCVQVEIVPALDADGDLERVGDGDVGFPVVVGEADLGA